MERRNKRTALTVLLLSVAAAVAYARLTADPNRIDAGAQSHDKVALKAAAASYAPKGRDLAPPKALGFEPKN